MVKLDLSINGMDNFPDVIEMIKDTIDNNDIDRLVDWLKTYPRLTKGPVTLELESKYSDWLGRKRHIFVLIFGVIYKYSRQIKKPSHPRYNSY